MNMKMWKKEKLSTDLENGPVSIFLSFVVDIMWIDTNLIFLFSSYDWVLKKPRSFPQTVKV